MEIIVTAPCHVPLVIGGAERLWAGLADHLNQRTEHVADVIKLPGPERDFHEVLDSYRRFAGLDLRHYETVISTKYPAWMTDHPNHVCYLQHPLRGLYDTYPAHLPRECPADHPELRSLLALIRGGAHTREALHECFERLDRLQAPRRLRRPVPQDVFGFPGPLIRELVQFFDRVAFRPGAIRRFFAISKVVATRDGYFPAHADVGVVHHPSHLTGFAAPQPGRYFFTVSRLDHPKRIDLLIEATRQLGDGSELWIAGTGPDEQRLRDAAGGDPRIRFLGFVNDAALLRHYAEAIAVLYVPLDEDLGLVALEAGDAGKPVITAHDTGGVAELVHDGVNGLVTDPDPGRIATAMRRLREDPELTGRLGQAGRERAAQVSWDRVCRTLLGEPRPA